MLLKIGDLARRTGLTIRTLHHYDDIGLLRPSARSPSGYRLYDRSDIARLHRIQGLRRVGLSLQEVASLLDSEGADLKSVIEQQIVALDRQVAETMALRDRLALLVRNLADNHEPDLDDWLVTLALMTASHAYLTDEEIATLRTRRHMSVGEPALQWPILIDQIHSLMDRGVPPEDEAAQEAAYRWMTLAQATMGNDARFLARIAAVHRNDATVSALTGVDGAMLDYTMHASAEYRFRRYTAYLTSEQAEKARPHYRKNLLAWPQMVAQMREQMAVGKPPSDPVVQELVARWKALSDEAWGNDPAILERIRAAHQQDPTLLLGTGIDQAMLAYLAQGLAILNAKNKEQT